MAEAQGTETENSAEKAYAAAAEAISEKTVAQAGAVEQAPEAVAAPAVEAKAEQPAAAQPAVEFPSKAKRGPKPAVTLPGLTDQDAGRFPVTKTAKAVAPAAEAPKPVVEAAPAPKAVEAKPVKAAPVKLAKVAVAKPVKAAKAPAAAKTVPAKQVAAPVKASAKAPTAKADKIVTAKKIPTVSLLKEKIMATKNATKGKNFAENLKGRFAEVQEKAKATFEKGSAAFGEYTEFTKGNFNAVVESGKIVAAGLQGIRTSNVADGRSALETLTADVKQFAAVKNPADFVKLQRELTQRNFKQAVAFGSKNKDALTKLANEAIAPITGRVNLVVEKFKKAA